MAERLFQLRADLKPGGKVLLTAFTVEGKLVRKRFSLMDSHQPDKIQELAADPAGLMTFSLKEKPEGGSGT